MLALMGTGCWPIENGSKKVEYSMDRGEKMEGVAGNMGQMDLFCTSTTE
jgi:hypothetical protein